MSDDGYYYNPFCTSYCGNNIFDAKAIIVPNCSSHCGNLNISNYQLAIYAPLCTNYCVDYNQAYELIVTSPRC